MSCGVGSFFNFYEIKTKVRRKLHIVFLDFSLLTENVTLKTFDSSEFLFSLIFVNHTVKPYQTQHSHCGQIL